LFENSLAAYAENDPTGAADEILGKIAVITWRGMMTKLMLAVYEMENVSRGMRADGWEMNAMLIDVSSSFSVIIQRLVLTHIIEIDRVVSISKNRTLPRNSPRNQLQNLLTPCKVTTGTPSNPTPQLLQRTHQDLQIK